MLNVEAGDEDAQGIADRNSDQPWLFIEPRRERRCRNCEQHDSPAQSDVCPEERADLLVVKVGPLNRRCRQSEVLKHSEEADENRDHANQAVIPRRQQTSEHNSRGQAQTKLADLRRERDHAASGGAGAQIGA